MSLTLHKKLEKARNYLIEISKQFHANEVGRGTLNLAVEELEAIEKEMNNPVREFLSVTKKLLANKSFSLTLGEYSSYHDKLAAAEQYLDNLDDKEKK